MSDIPTRRLGDVLKKRHDRATGEEQLLSVTNSRGVVRQVEAGRRDISSVNKSNYRLVKAGDIVYNTMRMWQGVSGESQYDGIVSPAYTVCAPTAEADSRFLAHLLKLPQLIQKFGTSSQGLVSDTWNLRYIEFARITAPIPSLSEQRRIAEILDTVGESIRSTERLLSKLGATTFGLLNLLLDSSEIQRWEHGTVATWGKVTLGRQRSPVSERGSGMTPYLRVANVFDGRIDFTDVLTMNFSSGERQRYSLKRGDLLLNEGQSLELVGRCAKFDGPDDVYCFQNTLVRYRCNDRLIPDFAYLVFSWWLKVGRFMQIAKQTTSIAHLGAGRFAKMHMEIPSIDTQRRICSVLAAHNSKLEATRSELAKLRKIKKGLMEDLLTGRVRVMD